jgi:hypothetical protein
LYHLQVARTLRRTGNPAAGSFDDDLAHPADALFAEASDPVLLLIDALAAIPKPSNALVMRDMKSFIPRLLLQCAQMSSTQFWTNNANLGLP